MWLRVPVAEEEPAPGVAARDQILCEQAQRPGNELVLRGRGTGQGEVEPFAAWRAPPVPLVGVRDGPRRQGLGRCGCPPDHRHDELADVAAAWPREPGIIWAGQRF